MVGVWAGIVARWQSYRKERHQRGLELKPNRQGVYVASDWTAHVDKGAGWIRNAAYGFVFLLWTVMGGAYLFWGRDGLQWLASQAFTLLQ